MPAAAPPADRSLPAERSAGPVLTMSPSSTVSWFRVPLMIGLTLTRLPCNIGVVRADVGLAIVVIMDSPNQRGNDGETTIRPIISVWRGWLSAFCLALPAPCHLPTLPTLGGAYLLTHARRLQALAVSVGGEFSALRFCGPRCEDFCSSAMFLTSFSTGKRMRVRQRTTASAASPMSSRTAPSPRDNCKPRRPDCSPPGQVQTGHR